jgi:hypothetical protein
MALIYQLYRETDCAKFSEAWISLEYTMAIFGSSFNSGAIISKKLSTSELQVQSPKVGEALTFHMDSSLLGVIYTRNVFAGMNLIWHIAELHVHVYFIILWENRYKKSYALFAMNSLLGSISLYLKRNAQGCL